ncbi:hypothetical protein H633G_11198 [Metarhizium anisopliae BRIP 53284]|nr:hypothetical protein H633G_11198 [Metarhizium anisopliae BRIP 53284]
MAVKRSLPISQDITQSVEEHNAVSGAGHKQEESEQEHDLDSDNSVLDTDDPYDSDGAEDTQSDDEDSNNTTNQGGQSQQFTQAGDPMDLDEAEEDHEIHHLFISRKPVADSMSQEKWTSYCFRRGHANALLGIAPDSIVDQVMRHDPLTGCLQNAYQNSRVGFNTQDAFLERDPSADGLTRAFTHMSIKCNPEVPKQIPKAELAKLPPDPEVVRLAKQVEAMARRMRQDYGFIKAAPERVREEYQQLRKDLRSTEKAFRDDMTKVYQEECRRRLHNEELQRQLSEMTVDPELDERAKPEPSVQHQLEERTKLQAILSDFRQDLDAKATTDRKVRAVELMVLLASCREVRRPTVSTSSSLCQGSIRPGSPDIKPAVPNVKVEEIPVVLGETQCIYCVGEEQLPYSRRMRSFGRKSHMWDHVENLHLKYERKDGPFTCPHPHCRPLGDSLRSLTTFKNHVQRVHGVRLRG